MTEFNSVEALLEGTSLKDSLPLLIKCYKHPSYKDSIIAAYINENEDSSIRLMTKTVVNIFNDEIMFSNRMKHNDLNIYMSYDDTIYPMG